MPPELTVGICCLNGETTLARTITSVHAQTIADDIELIVVDDGSTDDTAAIAEENGARVIRHPRNRGPAAARNTVARAASAPVVLYLDDDCQAVPDWAERHLRLYDDPRVVGSGGPVMASGGERYLQQYLARNSPAGILEADLGASDALIWRLRHYLRRTWSSAVPSGPVAAYALAGGNMGFRREIILAVGGFDERYAFGPEDYDLCLRIHDAAPDARLMGDPNAPVFHEYEGTIGDTLRRSVSYGRNGAALYRRRPNMRLGLLPLPVITLAGLILGRRRPIVLAGLAVLPHLLYTGGLRSAIRERQASHLGDAYVTLMQESATTLGYLQVVLSGERERPAEAPQPDAALLAQSVAHLDPALDAPASGQSS